MIYKDNVFEYKIKNYISDGANIHIFKINSVRKNTVHTHDFLELVYILKGEGIEWINGKEYAVKKGDLVVVNYGQTHAFRPGDGGMTYVNIMINLDFFNDSVIKSDDAFGILVLSAFEDIRNDVNRKLNVVSFSPDEYKSIETIIEAMVKEYQCKDPAYNAALNGYLNVLLVKIARKIRVGICDTEQTDIWKEITEYISENLNENISLKALSEKCFYNPSYFSRVFKEKFGMTLTDYIIGKRLDHAAFLLKTGNATVEYISQRCGFSSKAAFYRSFAKKFGCTPNEYRSLNIKTEG